MTQPKYPTDKGQKQEVLNKWHNDQVKTPEKLTEALKPVDNEPG